MVSRNKFIVGMIGTVFALLAARLLVGCEPEMNHCDIAKESAFRAVIDRDRTIKVRYTNLNSYLVSICTYPGYYCVTARNQAGFDDTLPSDDKLRTANDLDWSIVSPGSTIEWSVFNLPLGTNPNCSELSKMSVIGSNVTHVPKFLRTVVKHDASEEFPGKLPISPSS